MFAKPANSEIACSISQYAGLLWYDLLALVEQARNCLCHILEVWEDRIHSQSVNASNVLTMGPANLVSRMVILSPIDSTAHIQVFK